MKQLRICSSLNLHQNPGEEISAYIKAGLAFHKKMGFEKLCEVDRVGYKQGKWYGLTWYRLALCDKVAPIVEFPRLDGGAVSAILEKYAR